MTRSPTCGSALEHFPRFTEHIEALHNRDVDYFLSYASAETSPSVDVSRLIWKKVGTSALYPVCATDEAGHPRFAMVEGAAEPLPYISRTSGSFLGEVLENAQAAWSVQLDKVIEVASTHQFAFDHQGRSWRRLADTGKRWSVNCVRAN